MKHGVLGRRIFNEVDHPPLFSIGDEVCLDSKQGFKIWTESAPFFDHVERDPHATPLNKQERVEVAMTKKYLVRVIEQRNDSLVWNIGIESATGFAYKNIYLYWLDEITDYKDGRRQSVERLYGVPEPFLKRVNQIVQHKSETNHKTNSSWGMF